MATSQLIARWEAPASRKSSYSGVSVITDDTDASRKPKILHGLFKKQLKIEHKPKSWSVRSWKKDGLKLGERVGGGCLGTNLSTRARKGLSQSHSAASRYALHL